MKDWDHLVTAARVSELHQDGMSHYGGGIASAPTAGCVEGSLGNAWTAELYQDDSPGRVRGLAFAGYLLFYLVLDHCFTDGNKRVAWLVAMAILAALNVRPQATTDEAEAMIRDVIEGRIVSGADVSHWLAERLVAN